MLNLLKRFPGAYRRSFYLGPAAKLLEVFFDLLTPVVIARMIDEGIGARSIEVTVRYGLVLVVFAVVGIAFTLVCQKMAAVASQGMGTAIRAELYAHVNRLSYAELDRFGTPSLITRITNDVNQVQLAVALGIRQLVRWPFLALGSVAAALMIDLRLGLIFLVCAPVVGGVFWLVMARLIPFFKQLQQQLDRLGLLTREGLTGVRVIRAYAREDHERARFHDAAGAQAATAIALGRLSSVLNPVTFLVMNLAVCVILWQGGSIVNAGELTQGEVMAFVNYMTQTLLSIVYVANLVVVFTKASASAQRVNEVLALTPSIADAKDAAPVTPDLTALAIKLDNVGFTYPGAAAPAVSDISLALPAGGTLGIIGGTGSGKSTLVNLLPRLYDAGTGTVELWGTPVRDWPVEQLRASIGLVPQRASLVSGTIRSNLCWRDANATDEELMSALAVAQAAEFVRKLPQGLDAPVEAGGRNFSGGQRQRLTIARALVGDPSLLILDDSASALDLKTDAALRHAVRDLSRAAAAHATSHAEDLACKPAAPLTTVIVSQRISSVRDADLVLVMRRGHAAGLGTHEELARSCEVYREICVSQGVEVPASESGTAVSASGGDPDSSAAATPTAPQVPSQKGGDAA